MYTLKYIGYIQLPRSNEQSLVESLCVSYYFTVFFDVFPNSESRIIMFEALHFSQGTTLLMITLDNFYS